MKAGTFLVVGEVAKPHGVKGELSVLCHADSPSLFERVETVRLSPPPAAGARRGPSSGGGANRSRTYRVLASRVHGDRALVTLEGVADRDAAEALRGRLVEMAAADLPEPGPDEIYAYELIGCRVRLAAEAGGTSASADSPDPFDLGEIEAVSFDTGQELWTIRHPSGREILFPAAPELVTRVDLDDGLVVVAPPPGLLELFLEEPQAPSNAS